MKKFAKVLICIATLSFNLSCNTNNQSNTNQPKYSYSVSGSTSIKEGQSSIGKALLKADLNILGDNLSIKISKIDETSFISDGVTYLKVGSPETFGVDKIKQTIKKGDNSIKLSINLNEQTWDSGNEKNYFIRIETDGWSWLGPIKIIRK